MLLEEPDHREGKEGRHERGVLLEDVAAVLDRPDDRGVRRRAADAPLLERAHERRLGEARRRRRLVSLRLQLDCTHLVALRQVRQPPFVVLTAAVARLRLVAALLIGGEEAPEGDHGARSCKLGYLACRRGAGNADGDGLALRVGHLRCDRADPDQLVERALVRGQLAGDLLRRAEGVPGGTDRLVGLLRVLDLALVAARLVGDVLGAEEVARLLPGGGERRLGEGRRVGSHVGDVAVLVEALGHAHGRLCGEAELAAGVLLQRRRHERRAGTPRVRLALDAPNAKLRTLEPLSQPVCALRVQQEQRFVAKVAVAAEVTAGRDAAAVDRRELGLERLRVEGRLDVPPGRAHERHPFALALHNEPGRDRLDSPCREPAHDLLPEDGRDLVAVEPVEDAARLLRIDEPLVDAARLLQRALDRVPRDLVEDHPPDRDLRLQHLEQVPRNRLPLAVLVRREQHLVRLGDALLQRLDGLLLVRVDDVERLEIVLDVNAQPRPRLLLVLRRDFGCALREVANVTDTRLDHIVVVQVARDRPRLGGRLDDDDTFSFWFGCHAFSP